MKTAARIAILGLVYLALALNLTPVAADPLPGRDILKFQQLPMVATSIEGAIYRGHDELSTINGNHATGLYGSATGIFPPGTFMADDFSDTFDSPVVHVKWWGSYFNNELGVGGIRRFLISFEEDRPAGTDGLSYSHPGQPLLTQTIDRGPLGVASGTFSEKFVGPAGSAAMPEDIYEYNGELALPFNQLADTVYWLKIVALVDPFSDVLIPGDTLEWGWHSRDWTVPDPLASLAPVPGESVIGFTPGGTPVWHFQDDAIQGEIDNVNLFPPTPTPPGGIAMEQPLIAMLPQNYIDDVDGPIGIGSFSKDLAFELYTVPEPSTLVLAAFGLIGLLHFGWRQRRKTSQA